MSAGPPLPSTVTSLTAQEAATWDQIKRDVEAEMRRDEDLEDVERLGAGERLEDGAYLLAVLRMFMLRCGYDPGPMASASPEARNVDRGLRRTMIQEAKQGLR